MSDMGLAFSLYANGNLSFPVHSQLNSALTLDVSRLY